MSLTRKSFQKLKSRSTRFNSNPKVSLKKQSHKFIANKKTSRYSGHIKHSKMIGIPLFKINTLPKINRGFLNNCQDKRKKNLVRLLRCSNVKFMHQNIKRINHILSE